MKCRCCGGCCIAPSISSPFPGMKNGKLAGIKCIHLSQENLCKIYQSPDRPKVCRSYQPSIEFCGNSFKDAINILTHIETITHLKIGAQKEIIKSGL